MMQSYQHLINIEKDENVYKYTGFSPLLHYFHNYIVHTCTFVTIYT